MVLGELSPNMLWLIGTSAVIYIMTAAAIMLGWGPLRSFILRQERQFDEVLRSKLLLDIKPRTATILNFIGIACVATLGYVFTSNSFGVAIGLGAGMFLGPLTLRHLKRRRMVLLEDQLVDGIQTLASGVRAGLNLVQAMQLVGRDGPIPLRQEFRHLLREYDYGVPLEEAMENAAARIGSGDFRLLFAALQTHRERGGDLGETLDRIAASIREIQRLENRVKTLTAQGRTTARWLGAMPIVIMVILHFVVGGVDLLFTDPIGKVIILTIITLNVIGFLWIKRIVSLDV